ncbi:MAG TPA: hypothetical protein IAB63_07265 [Candidatus Onthocola gallistercoris]|uniref:Uncharacterized protein n=1 Tax=Candidatus Onthocola gallistercoris TaxID=2840876 RepID=A0A9D1KY10_9FIRM|nr:hypothetical protein [Candidatus Onthocola gallistercoris]
MKKKEKVRRTDLSIYSNDQLKKYSRYLMIIGILLICAGVAATLISPALFLLMIIAGAVCAIAGTDYKKELKKREEMFND